MSENIAKLIVSKTHNIQSNQNCCAQIRGFLKKLHNPADRTKKVKSEFVTYFSQRHYEYYNW